MRLGDYFSVLRRQWLPVVICLGLGIGLAFAYIELAPRHYQSMTAVLVLPIQNSVGTGADKNSINLDTEAQLLTATNTVAAAAGVLHVPPDGLASQVAVTVPPNTDILDITFTADTPVQAQRGSLAFARAYLDQRSNQANSALQAQEKALQVRLDALSGQLQQTIQAGQGLPANSADKARNNDQAAALNQQIASLGSQQNQLQATIVTPGTIVTQPPLPTSPSSPKKLIALLAGAVLGLVAGLGLAALRHRADDVVRSPEDLYRRTRLPVATVLSTRLHDGELSILPAMSADGRGYARLRNLATTALANRRRPVLVVAGVRHGGGPVAANLAAALARAGDDTYLVCADVFGSTSASLLGPHPRDGLAEVLAGEVDVRSAVQRIDGIPTLLVLGSGRDPDRADALLQTRSPRTMMDRMLEKSSYVVIEAPATVTSPDAQTLANVAELAVLVVELGQTRAHEVLDACAQFESMGTPVLGAVVVRYGRDSESRGVAEETEAEAATPSVDADEVAPTVETSIQRVTETRPVPLAGERSATTKPIDVTEEASRAFAQPGSSD